MDTLIQNLSQVYEPNRIVDNPIINEQDDITCTEDNQITEIEGHVTTLPYNQSLLSSTQDSIESIATPQKQTWTTNKFVLCWLHHGTYWSEKQVRNDRKLITLKEKA